MFHPLPKKRHVLLREKFAYSTQNSAERGWVTCFFLLIFGFPSWKTLEGNSYLSALIYKYVTVVIRYWLKYQERSATGE